MMEDDIKDLIKIDVYNIHLLSLGHSTHHLFAEGSEEVRYDFQLLNLKKQVKPRKGKALGLPHSDLPVH